MCLIHRLVFCLSLFSGCTSALADTITLVSDPWCPYNCESDSQYPGFMVEIARDIFAEHGHTVIYRTLPWSRALIEVHKGRYDGIIGANRIEAKGLVIPDNYQALAKGTFFVLKGNTWRYEGLESIQKIKLAVNADYDLGDVLNDFVEESDENRDQVMRISGIDATYQMIDLVLEGRADALFTSEEVVKYLLLKMDKSGSLVNAGSLDSNFELYIAFSPHLSFSKVYAKILSEGMKVLQENGRLEMIMDKYR